MPMRLASALRTATDTSTPARTTSNPSTPESLAAQRPTVVMRMWTSMFSPKSRTNDGAPAIAADRLPARYV
jgi:hypothetical protein